MSELHINTKVLGILILLGWMMMLAIEPISQAVDDHTTPQPWFSVGFVVPDHHVGSDPLLSYDRFPMRLVEGRWFVSVYRMSGQAAEFVCNGSGEATYNPSRQNTLLMRLHTFVGNSDCPWQPGVHEMCAEYVLRDPGRNLERTFGPFCGEFDVLEPMTSD